nr:DNA-directed DNA polymerase [Tanacetum cinerariifolium]
YFYRYFYAYQGPTILTPSKVVKQGTEVTKDQVQTLSSQRTAPVQPPVVQSKTQTLVFEPVVTPVSAPMPNLKPSIPYPSRHDNERRRDQANKQMEKFYEIFKDMSFEISFTDALILMPKFASTLKALIGNKEKLSEMTRTLMNEHCSAVILNKLPKKLGDPDKNKAIIYNLDQTLRYSANYNQITVNKIDVIDMACKEYSQEDLGFFDVTASGNPTPYDDLIFSITSPTLTPFGDSDFLLFEEAKSFLGLEDDPNSPEFNPFYYDPEGDILLVEAILNSKSLPPLPNHEQYMPSFKTELKGINLEFCAHKILVEEDYKPVVQHQRQVNPKIYDVIKKEVKKLLDAGLIYPISDSPRVSPIHFVPKKGGFTVVENGENELIPTRLVTEWRTMEVFMDDFSVFGNSFENCLSRLDKMLQRCEDTNLCLNWEKSHFIIKEGITLGHKISKNEIEVDKAKVNIIAKLPHLTTVKGAVLEQRHEKHFRPIYYASKTMTDAESNYTTTEKEMLAVVYAFDKFWSYLIMNKSIVHTDHFALKYLFAKKDAKARLLRWVLHLQEFNFKVLDMKGAENLAADHLSRLENPYENVLDPKEINETFPLETLSMVTFRGDSSASWFADFTNYHAGNFIVKVIWRYVHDKEALDILESCHNGPTGGHHGANLISKKVFDAGFFWPTIYEDAHEFVKNRDSALTFWARSRLHEGTNIFSWSSIICQNGLKRKRSPPMTPELFESSLNLSWPDLVPLKLS